jgi:hypothetical protein
MFLQYNITVINLFLRKMVLKWNLLCRIDNKYTADHDCGLPTFNTVCGEYN